METIGKIFAAIGNTIETTETMGTDLVSIGSAIDTMGNIIDVIGNTIETTGADLEFIADTVDTMENTTGATALLLYNSLFPSLALMS